MNMRYLIAACLIFVNCGSSQATEKLVPVDAFVEKQQYSIPRLSPDGKYIALNVRVQRNDRTIPTMTIYSLPELELVTTIALPGYEIPVGFRWITNTRLIVNKGHEVGEDEKPVSNGEVLAVNFDGTQSEYLYGFKAMKFSSRGDRNGNDSGSGAVAHVPSAMDGHVILVSHEWRSDRTMLYDINSMNSSRKLIANIGMKNLNFKFQNNGQPRFATGTDENNDPVLFKFDDSRAEWQKVETKSFGRGYHPIAFLQGDRAFLASYSKAGEPYSLVREELSTGERSTLIKDNFGDIDQIEFAANSEMPFAVTISTGIPSARYIDKTSEDAKLHQTLSALFPQAYVHFINFTDDGKTLLFSVISDRDPGSFYLFNRTTAKADLLFTNKPQIDPEEMAERRPVRFTSRDGTEITGYLTLPKKSDGKKLPLVLHPHGGPFGVKDTWYFDDDSQFLASRGYAVLQVNFRGSSGRGINFKESGYKEWGGKIMNDLIDGVKWANALPEIDAGRVCVYGASFGGYAALMLPVREPTMFKCAVGYAGRYDLSSKYTQDSIKGDKQGKNFLEKTLGSDPIELAKNSPTNLADQIKLPVMLVHGEKDKTTELNQAEMMRDALIKAGNPPDWTVEKNEGHGFYGSEHRKAFYLKLEAFLKEHIGR